MLLSLPASTSMTEKEKEFLLMVSSDDEEEEEILSFSVAPSYCKSKLNNGKKLSNRLLVKTTILQFAFFIELIVVIAFDPFDLGTLSKYEL